MWSPLGTLTPLFQLSRLQVPAWDFTHGPLGAGVAYEPAEHRCA